MSLLFAQTLLASPNVPPALHEVADNYVTQRQTNTLISTYGHENTWVENEVRTNCYGFINFILKRYFPQAHDELVSFMNAHKTVPISIDGIPCPFHFSALFETLQQKPKASNHFDYVTHDAIQAGDMIIYEPINHTPQANALFSPKPTGMHIMVVKTVVTSGENFAVFEIIDCTKSRHDKQFDSRASLPKGKRGGIGRAKLYLKKNENGIFDRFKWSPGGKIYHKTITVGRLKTKPA